MSMYLNIPGIPGSTSAQGYQQWIPICAVNWGLDRPIDTVPGKTADRVRSTAMGYEIEVLKDPDQASPLLFGQVCGGKAIPTSSNSCLLCQQQWIVALSPIYPQ